MSWSQIMAEGSCHVEGTESRERAALVEVEQACGPSNGGETYHDDPLDDLVTRLKDDADLKQAM